VLENKFMLQFSFEDYLNFHPSVYKKDLILFLSCLSFEIDFFDVSKAINESCKSLELLTSRELLEYSRLEYSLRQSGENLPTLSVSSLPLDSLLSGFYPVIRSAKFLVEDHDSRAYRLTIQKDGSFFALSFYLDGIVEMLNFILLEQYLVQYLPLRYLLSSDFLRFEIGLEALEPHVKLSMVFQQLGVIKDLEVSRLLGLNLSTVVRYRNLKEYPSFFVPSKGIKIYKDRVPLSLYPFFSMATKYDIFLDFLQEGFKGTKKIALLCNLSSQWVNQYRNELVLLLLRRMVFVTAKEFRWLKS